MWKHCWRAGSRRSVPFPDYGRKVLPRLAQGATAPYDCRAARASCDALELPQGDTVVPATLRSYR